jgi:hypothetical protein
MAPRPADRAGNPFRGFIDNQQADEASVRSATPADELSIDRPFA